MSYHISNENWISSNTLAWTPVSSTDAWNTSSVTNWNSTPQSFDPISQWKTSALSPRKIAKRIPLNSQKNLENSSKFYEVQWNDIYPTQDEEPNAPPQLPSTEFVNMETSPNPWVPRPIIPLLPLTPVTPESGPSSPKSPANSLKRNSDIEAELNRQNLYKTEMCRSWVENGQCRYGSKCQFAHGQHELRPVMRHPKYKTEICKTFHTTGTCPYGKRCRFIHHPPDLSCLSPTSNTPDNYHEMSPILPPPVFTPKNDEEMTTKIEQKLAELKISLLAPDPVFNPNHISTIDESETKNKKSTTPSSQKKGSRLPFFQKLRERKKH